PRLLLQSGRPGPPILRGSRGCGVRCGDRRNWNSRGKRMNYGPLIFLAAFFALAGSWFGFVLTPQMQVGQLQQTNTVPDGVTYPLARPGLAREGLDVYRAHACAACHSQQVRQSGIVCDVLLTDGGTNRTALTQVLQQINPDLTEAKVEE